MTLGKHYEKISLRIGIPLAILFGAANYYVLATWLNQYTIYLAAFLQGLCYSFGAIVPVTRAINAWFLDKRSTCIGIASTGSGIATFIMPLIITLFMSIGGLKSALMANVTLMLICACIALIFMRNKPSDIGEKPFVDRAPAEITHSIKQHPEEDLKGIYHVLLYVALFLCGFIANASMNHAAIHLATAGYADSIMSLFMAAYGFMMIFTKMFFGVLSDHVGAYRANTIYFITLIISLFWMAYIGARHAGLPVMMILCLFFSVGAALPSVGTAVWTENLARPESVNRMMRHGQTCFSTGTLSGSFIPGVIADLTGDYVVNFIMIGTLAVAMAFIVQKLYRKQGL